MSDGSESPANWYPDPATPGMWRYWDGSNWTEFVSMSHPDLSAQKGAATELSLTEGISSGDLNYDFDEYAEDEEAEPEEPDSGRSGLAGWVTGHKKIVAGIMVIFIISLLLLSRGCRAGMAEDEESTTTAVPSTEATPTTTMPLPTTTTAPPTTTTAPPTTTTTEPEPVDPLPASTSNIKYVGIVDQGYTIRNTGPETFEAYLGASVVNWNQDQGLCDVKIQISILDPFNMPLATLVETVDIIPPRFSVSIAPPAIVVNGAVGPSKVVIQTISAGDLIDGFNVADCGTLSPSMTGIYFDVSDGFISFVPDIVRLGGRITNQTQDRASFVEVRCLLRDPAGRIVAGVTLDITSPLSPGDNVAFETLLPPTLLSQGSSPSCSAFKVNR